MDANCNHANTVSGIKVEFSAALVTTNTDHGSVAVDREFNIAVTSVRMDVKVLAVHVIILSERTLGKVERFDPEPMHPQRCQDDISAGGRVSRQRDQVGFS